MPQRYRRRMALQQTPNPKKRMARPHVSLWKKCQGKWGKNIFCPHACEGRFTMHNNLQQCACHTPEFACSVQLDTVSIQVLVQQSKVSTRSIDSLFFCNRSLGQSCFGQCGAWSRAWRLHWFCIPVVQWCNLRIIWFSDWPLLQRMYCSLSLYPPLSSFIHIYPLRHQPAQAPPSAWTHLDVRPLWGHRLCPQRAAKWAAELWGWSSQKACSRSVGPCLGEKFQRINHWLIWFRAWALHFCLWQAKRELLGSKSRSKDLIPGIPCLQIVDLMWIFALAALFVCLVGVRCDTVEYVFDCTWIVLVVRLQHWCRPLWLHIAGCSVSTAFLLRSLPRNLLRWLEGWELKGVRECEKHWSLEFVGQIKIHRKMSIQFDSKDWKWKEAKIQAPCRVKLIYAAMWRVLRPVPPTSWNAVRIFLASDTPHSVNNPGSKNWMKLAILEHRVIKVIFHGHPGTDFPLPWLLKRGRERERVTIHLNTRGETSFWTGLRRIPRFWQWLVRRWDRLLCNCYWKLKTYH